MNFTNQEPLYILAVLSLVLLVSEWLSKKAVFNKFGIALLVIILTALVANIGIIPTVANPVYDGIFEYVAPIALFLLLLDVNLGQLKRVGIPILLVFLMGALGTLLGVVTAIYFIKDQPAFGGAYNALAGMFTGTYIGGSINFNAVALHYNVVGKSVLYTNAVAVDNVITTVWFFITVALPVGLQRLLPRQVPEVSDPNIGTEEARPSDEQAVLNLKTLSVWIGLGSFCLYLSNVLSDFFAGMGVGVPSILILTSLALLVAQIPAITKLKGNMLLGSWAIYLFLAVVGAFCDIGALSNSGSVALLLFLFVLITLVVHGFVIFGINIFTKYDWQLIAIASQANIGGGTTAMALAKNFNRNELILPAIVIGSLGNALGTYVGFLVAGML
jgi:uncharacterized membrane protein